MRVTMPGIGEKQETSMGETTIEDYAFIPYRNGKFFVRYLLEDLLKLLAADMTNNIKNRYDNVVVIEGAEGSGKSNLQLELQTLYDPNFTLENGYVYNVDEFKEKIAFGNDEKKTYWLDEATNVQNNRRWSSIDNQNFVMLLETMRSRGWCLILCIPSFERLDVYIREHRIKYLIKCEPMCFMKSGKKERGFFELRKKNEYGKMEVVGYGKYNKMSDEEREDYEKLKMNSQLRMISEVVGTEKSGSKYKAKYEEMCKREDQIMYRLYKSGSCNSEQLKMMFGIKNEQTFRNKLTKGKKMVNKNDTRKSRRDALEVTR